MSLYRLLICILEDKIHKVEIHGEPAFVIDNKMLEDINWSLHKVVMINPIMMAGECIHHWKWKRLQVTRWV